MNKNIVFLLRLWPFFGGGETVSICLANEFIKRGYNVNVLYFKTTSNEKALPINPKVNAVKIDGIECDDTRVDKADAKKVQTFLIEFIKTNQIGYVINQWWPISYFASIKSETKAYVVKCNHTAFFHPEIKWTGFKGFLKRLFKAQYMNCLKKEAVADVEAYLPYVDKYVFLSDRFVNQYMEFGGDNSDHKVLAIPNPLPYENKATDSSHFHKRDEVLFVGRIVDSLKRLSISLNAWVEIEKDYELDNWNLVVVGDGPDLPMLKEKAIQLGLKRVRFEGFQKPESYYMRAKILVQNSSFEGFGMTIVEAQQNGCVPVAMDTFLTVHDLINNGYNGVLTLDDQKDFTQQLISLMKNNLLVNNMSAKAVETSKSFSVNIIVDRWENLFNEMMINNISNDKATN